MKCVNGCIVFENGDIKHHKTCPLYNESLTMIKDLLEEENKIMLNCLIRCYIDMDNVDRVCELARVHGFDLMRKDLQYTIEQVTGKSIEEATKVYPIMGE